MHRKHTRKTQHESTRENTTGTLQREKHTSDKRKQIQHKGTHIFKRIIQMKHAQKRHT